MLLKRGEIVQVANDRRIVVGFRAIAGENAPGERAQLVGRCLNRVDAWK
jgi:hypothetical protein